LPPAQEIRGGNDRFQAQSPCVPQSGREHEADRSRPVVDRRHHLHQAGNGVRLPGGGARRILPPGDRVGAGSLAPEDFPGAVSYFSDQPEWFDAAKIVASIDERGADPDKMPIASMLQAAARLRSTEIIELITTFVPAPGIDILKRKGFRVWSVREDGELVRTYVLRPAAQGEKSMPVR